MKRGGANQPALPKDLSAWERGHSAVDSWLSLAEVLRASAGSWEEEISQAVRLGLQPAGHGPEVLYLCLGSPGREEELRFRLRVLPQGACEVEAFGRECQICRPRSGEPEPGAPDAAGAMPCGATAVVPMCYQDGEVGHLALRCFAVDDLPRYFALAKEVAYQLKRWEVRSRIRERFGRDLACVGMSQALRRVDEFVEKGSESDCAALLVGEPGSELSYLAHALHFAGPRRDGPFVAALCSAFDSATFREEVMASLSRASKGTLFLNGIEELEPRLQAQLVEILEGIDPAAGEGLRTRIVTSVRGEPASSRRPEEILYPPLLAAIDFLRLEIPPLSRRREDVRPLVGHFLNRHGASSGRRQFSEPALQLLEAYSWPGGVAELERAVVRLVVMSERQVVEVEDVCAYEPKLTDGMGGCAEEVSQLLCNYADTAVEPGGDSAGMGLVQLAGHLLEGELSNLGSLHPGLSQALTYLAGHFSGDLSGQTLAKQAGVSFSHLSRLMRKNLDVSFKKLLAMVRVMEAARVLGREPDVTVTDVATRVGFSDLRGCERAFKRLLGCSPRSYRRSLQPRG